MFSKASHACDGGRACRRIAAVAKKIVDKLSDEDGDRALVREETALDQVGPAPGDPWAQHAVMVGEGLANEAVKHERRNRYCNQYPFDSSLVRLKSVEYINASWIKGLPGLPKDKRFVITMGPLHPDSFGGDRDIPDTCGDFWEMVWELGTTRVVMMCGVEKGYQGCSTYFPRNPSDKVTMGRFAITNEKSKKEDGYVIRRLVIKLGDASRTVTHYQFLGWPNYGIPNSPPQVSGFVSRVYADAFAEAEPLVVHCSGGLGRSGCFTTVLSAYHMVVSAAGDEDDGAVADGFSLVETISKMRLQRHPWMVEGMEQYRLCHKALAYMLGETCEEAKKVVSLSVVITRKD